MIAGITQLLLSTAAVQTMVGSNITSLILPNDPPLPAITLQIISTVMSGNFSTKGYQRTRLQVDAWGTTYAQADQLRAAVIDALHMYSGTLSDGSIVRIRLLNETDFYEQDGLQFRCMSEFYIWSAVS